MNRTYLNQFDGPISVPQFLLTSPWTDVSWGNDMCPRFENLELMLAVWVNYDDPAMREDSDYPKFVVVALLPRPNDHPDLDINTMLETDDAVELAMFLKCGIAKATVQSMRENVVEAGKLLGEALDAARAMGDEVTQAEIERALDEVNTIVHASGGVMSKTMQELAESCASHDEVRCAVCCEPAPEIMPMSGPAAWVITPKNYTLLCPKCQVK